MLVTPLPGTDRDSLIDNLSTARNGADNLQGPFSGPTYGRLVAYLRWATATARMLRAQIRQVDVDRLVLTRRHDSLLAGASSGLAGSHQESFLNDLISLELAERVADFNETIAALTDRRDRWSSRGVFVVADTSVYIQHDSKLLEWDVQQLCQVREEPVHLLVPMVIVDELDGLKQTKEPHRRYRAAYTLAIFERHLPSGTGSAVIKEEDYSALDSGGIPNGRVAVEILYDPPGHTRLPINDDEIVDRAVAVQLLAGRSVRLITYDTGQAMRARAAGLTVIKMRHPAESEQEPTRSK